MAVAVFSGVMSSCFAYGLAAGEPIRQLTLAHGTPVLSQGLPVLCVVLFGGFCTNALWCLILIVKNRSAGQFIGHAPPADQDAGATPLLKNYLLCALGGAAWYFQFFFYTMGESQMGRFGFSSWTLHMASIIIFATLWGLALKEWKGASRHSRLLLALGIAILVASTVVIGFGNALSARG
jgi:L-rhamnose-H+ transport protein